MKLTKLQRALLSQLGKRGGKARSKSLSPERRSEIARLGGLAKNKKEVSVANDIPNA